MVPVLGTWRKLGPLFFRLCAWVVQFRAYTRIPNTTTLHTMASTYYSARYAIKAQAILLGLTTGSAIVTHFASPENTYEVLLGLSLVSVIQAFFLSRQFISKVLSIAGTAFNLIYVGDWLDKLEQASKVGYVTAFDISTSGLVVAGLGALVLAVILYSLIFPSEVTTTTLFDRSGDDGNDKDDEGEKPHTTRAHRQADDLLPTEKQLAYAKSLASRRGLAIPSECLESRKLMSAFIDEMKTAS